MQDKTIRVPVFITFSTDPAKLVDREVEKSPTEESLVAYLKDAMRLDVDDEGEGQPEGAVFAATGVDWDAAELVRATTRLPPNMRFSYRSSTSPSVWIESPLPKTPVAARSQAISSET
jgi:hypothetical protein